MGLVGRNQERVTEVLDEIASATGNHSLNILKRIYQLLKTSITWQMMSEEYDSIDILINNAGA